MKYVIRAFLGLGLMALSITSASYALYQFLQIGTCASGGPYVSARECPDDIEGLFFLMIGGIFLAFIATGIYAFRGEPPGGGGKRSAAAPIVMWCGLFLGMSFASFWGVWGPDANPGPGGKEGGLIVAFLFAVMGAAALPFIFSGKRPWSVESGVKSLSGLRTAIKTGGTGVAVGGTAPPLSSRASSGDDEVARLERLSRLRAEGTITEAEFQELKDKIVGGGAP